MDLIEFSGSFELKNQSPKEAKNEKRSISELYLTQEEFKE